MQCSCAIFQGYFQVGREHGFLQIKVYSDKADKLTADKAADFAKTKIFDGEDILSSRSYYTTLFVPSKNGKAIWCEPLLVPRAQFPERFDKPGCNILIFQ